MGKGNVMFSVLWALQTTLIQAFSWRCVIFGGHCADPFSFAPGGSPTAACMAPP